MKKEEFLNKLRKKLDVLEDKEIEDIISEYAGYIEEKVNRGLTEEEAVSELGDLNEIASDLLSAYKVNTKDTNYLKKFINKVSMMFDYFLKELENKNWKDILKIIIEIGLIIVLILVLKIPFLLFKDLGWTIFSGFSSPISNLFYGIWSFIIEISYLIIAVILFIKIIERRYFKGFSESIVEEMTEEPAKKEKVKNAKNEKESKEEQVVEKKIVESKKMSIVEMITNICILFIKFIVIMCLFGVIIYLIGMTFLIGLGIYLLIQGITYFGIFILLIALFLAGILLLELGIHFIFNKKIKVGSVLAQVLTSIVLAGLGLSLSTIEIANTELIYESAYETTSVSKEIEVNEHLALYGNYNIIIDNTLTNTVRIEYVYPDINDVEVSIHLNNYDNGYYLDYGINNLKWNKDLLNDFLDNLKEKKIYVYDFRIEKNIYMSEEIEELLYHNKEVNNQDNSVIYEFTRTYNVLNVEESNDEAYLYLTLRQFQFEEIETVRVLKSMAGSVEEGNNYEFTFRNNYSSVEIENDTIEELFTKCNLISIEYTDKVGLEQTQDPEIPYN